MTQSDPEPSSDGEMGQDFPPDETLPTGPAHGPASDQSAGQRVDDPAGSKGRAGVADTFDGLKSELIRRHESLPKRLKQVAAFALNHPEELALGTTSAIAASAGVQPSTLVRFAQAMGYSGFSDLQEIFRSRLRARLPEHWERVRALRKLDDAEPEVRLLEGFVSAGHQSLDRMRSTLRHDHLRETIDILAGARSIHMVAARRVFPVASYLTYAFGKLGVSAHCVDQIGAMGTEQVASAHLDDAVLAISYAPYAPTTLELARIASARGIPVVSITDSALSPLVPVSRCWLEVAENDYGAFRSLSATFALIMALAVAIADRRAKG